MKNIFSRNTLLIVLALVVFLIAWAFLRPAPEVPVLVAAANLPDGHILVTEDVAIRRMPTSLLPTDAVSQATLAVGQALKIGRAQGDILQRSQLGEDLVQLQANERAIAVQVTDSTGLAGLLKPGDKVGVVAVITNNNNNMGGAFSKVAIENMRVLYMAPAFAADDTADTAGTVITPDASGFAVQRQREKTGPVVLAVPVDAQVLNYDFSKAAYMPANPIEKRNVNALELLAALNDSDAKLSLYLMPKTSAPFNTSGLYLPDLIITSGPTPTATATLDPRFTPVPAAQNPGPTPTKGK